MMMDEEFQPMTQEQLEAEAVYAEKSYRELVTEATPETHRRIREAIKAKRRYNHVVTTE